MQVTSRHLSWYIETAIAALVYRGFWPIELCCSVRFAQSLRYDAYAACGAGIPM